MEVRRSIIIATGVVFLATCILSPAKADLVTQSDCIIPSYYRGEWHHMKFVDAVVSIYNQSIDTKIEDHQMGICTKQDKSKDFYIFFNGNRKHPCTKCLHIHSLHPNIMQYTESTCAEDEVKSGNPPREQSIEKVCSLLNQETTFYMIRKESTPIDCPFRKEAFLFSYKKGGAPDVCSNSKSHIESCMNDTQLVFRYEGCPDISGSEAKSEEISCLAHWFQGDHEYLVTKVYLQNPGDRPPTLVEGYYRCFIFYKIKESIGYKISISGQATCDGLQSTDSGVVSLTLYLDNHSKTICSFPKWFTSKSWHTLDHHTKFEVSSSRDSDILVESDHNPKDEDKMWPQMGKITCFNAIIPKHPEQEHIILAKEVIGCKSRNICLKLSKKSEFISELKLLKKNEATTQDEFISHCLQTSLDSTSSINSLTSQLLPDFQTFTLISETGVQSPCPFVGVYKLQKFLKGQNDFERSCNSHDPLHWQPSDLYAGCEDSKGVQFVDDCAGDGKQQREADAKCLGSWRSESEPEDYFLASFPKEKDRHPLIYCFKYFNQSSKILSFVGKAGDCPNSGKNISKTLSFELEFIGSCDSVARGDGTSDNLLTMDSGVGRLLPQYLILIVIVIKFVSLVTYYQYNF